MFNFPNLELYAATSWVFSEQIENANSGDKLFLCIASADGTTLKKYSSTSTPLTAGRNFQFLISKNDTDVLPGFYRWQLLLSGTLETVLAHGVSEILINCDTNGTPVDYWLKQVMNIRTVIDKLNMMTTTEVQYAGRVYKYKDIKVLTNLLAYAEKQAGIRKRTPRILERS